MVLTAARAYALLTENLHRPGCALCAALRTTVIEEIGEGLRAAEAAAGWLGGACPQHAPLLVERLESDPALLSETLRSVRDGLRLPARSRKPWQAWRRRRRDACKSCQTANRLEPKLVNWFLAALPDIRFERAYRSASPLCLAHQSRVLESGSPLAATFVEIQLSKLENLATGLVQHRYLGGRSAVLDALRAFLIPRERDQAPPLHEGGCVPTRSAEAPPAESDGLELVTLRAEVEELNRRLGESESRAAALHYRAAALAEENRDWERRYAAAASEARLLRAEASGEGLRSDARPGTKR